MTAAETIDVATAHQMWRLGDVVLDVRSPEEYAHGHVPGALNVPIDQVLTADLPAGQLLTTCTYGRRGRQAAERLAGIGRDAFSIDGGTEAWRRAGHPVTRGSEPGERSGSSRCARRRRR